MSRIVSFRGLLADDGQDTIPLQTNNGLIGYRITKFELIPQQPGGGTQESIVKIYKTEQSTIDDLIDFSDNRLLGAGAYLNNNHTYASPSNSQLIIFDNEKFNQDIYITHKDASTGLAVNYYIELEQMDLALDEATVATLKDIRNQ